MIVSEDGTVTGSIDVSRLDEINPSTDEAKAALEVLKRDIQAGAEQAAADAQRNAEQVAASNPLVNEPPQDQRDAQGKSTGANESQGLQQARESEEPATTTPGTNGPAAPRGNASREEWVAFAQSQGASDDDVRDLTREQLRERYA